MTNYQRIRFLFLLSAFVHLVFITKIIYIGKNQTKADIFYVTKVNYFYYNFDYNKETLNLKKT